MSNPPTHADTAWGVVCTAIHKRLQLDFPRLSLGIGPDGVSLLDAPPSCNFERNGPAPTVAGLRGAIFDRLIPIRCTLWMADPVEADQALGRLFIAINAEAHGRASKPVQEDVKGGEIGANGCKEIVTFTLRLAVVDEPAPVATAGNVSLANIALTDPAGATTEEGAP